MSRKKCFALTDERLAEEPTVELLLYFFPGLFIGLKQFGIAPCIIPFSSIEWHRMERRYIWPFLLTWRLESCVVFSACDSNRTTGDSRLYVPEMDTYWTKGFLHPEGSESLLIFWEQGRKTCSQLTQQIWSETGDLLTFLCLILSIWKPLEIGELPTGDPTNFADTELTLGFVCDTLLFCVVPLFYSWDAFNSCVSQTHTKKPTKDPKKNRF